MSLIKFYDSPLQTEATSRPGGRALARMDECIGYVTRPGHYGSNPAMGVVRFPVVAGFWIILAFLVITLVWGSLVPIESAVHAQGSVILYSSKKTVQHLEGGVINEILVKEGDKVTQGQKLIRLRDTASEAAQDSLQQELYTERADEARLLAELNHRDAVSFDADMTGKSAGDRQLADILSAHQQLFDAERAEEQAKLAELSQRIAQSQEEIKGLQAESEGSSGQMELLDKEIATVEELLGKGYATQTRLLTLQRNRSELFGSKGQYDAQIAKTQQMIAETQMAIINQQKDFEAKNLKDLRDTQVKVSELQGKLRSATDIEGRTVITAPTEGVVTGLRFHTVGGVINPGAPVMDIIPQGDDLVVEAHIRPADISMVTEGMDARIVFTSYKMRTTPRVPGKVTQVSADVFTDEHGSTTSPYYTARVQVDKDFLHKLKKSIELRPGLPVEVMVSTGSRSFMGYLLKPVVDSTHNAFREQ